jgi:protein-L-isoaspartate O-methyltransferase
MSQGIQNTNDEFKNSTLTFYADKIESDLFNAEVMMDWEDSIMAEHANIVCHNQGDVLEIGFGMGISADYIQSLNPTSHTIIEIHPQIWTNLQTWAVGKTNVTIINADWKDIENTLGQYDGIFYDAIYDINIVDFMKNFTSNHIKTGGRMTYFNNGGNNDIYGIGATFTSHVVTPTTNGYFNDNNYYVPTVQY